MKISCFSFIPKKFLNMANFSIFFFPDQAYPVDASLLHKALLELEALAEDSPSESHNSAILGFNAAYVKDITYPDGSQVPPGSQFVKTWRVSNSGVMPWNEKVRFVL